MSLAQPIDTFDEAGSFFTGLQAGYDYMLPNRWVIGGEFDVTAPSYQNLAGISIGNMTTFNSPFGSETYGETVLTSGTVRGRVG
jgi:high affinity Mn2+ porin